MERGDIYLVSLDPTSGHEQQGTRPVLIVSPATFNRLTRTPVVLPITSGGNFARTAGFTVSLIAAAQNADELAFVVGHEASHHILNHLARKSNSATAGAIILGGLAAAAGADSTTISSVQQMGANVGSRVYSKDWELQADYMGAIVTMNAGYDPVNGAEFFRRMPDPGNQILGSHP